MRLWVYAEKGVVAVMSFDPNDLVEHIDLFGKGLTDWEIKFIANLIDNPSDIYSKKQVAIIERIYNEKC